MNDDGLLEGRIAGDSNSDLFSESLLQDFYASQVSNTIKETTNNKYSLNFDTTWVTNFHFVESLEFGFKATTSERIQRGQETGCRGHHRQ